MEIIGKASENDFILTASRRELKEISDSSSTNNFHVGNTVDVDGIYNKLSQIRKNKRSIGEIRRECHLILTSLERMGAPISVHNNIIN